jgi:hypothetical protein
VFLYVCEKLQRDTSSLFVAASSMRCFGVIVFTASNTGVTLTGAGATPTGATGNGAATFVGAKGKSSVAII